MEAALGFNPITNPIPNLNQNPYIRKHKQALSLLAQHSQQQLTPLEELPTTMPQTEPNAINNQKDDARSSVISSRKAHNFGQVPYTNNKQFFF